MSLEIPDREDPSKVGIYYDLFSIGIESADFDVFEGVGSEVYILRDLAKRDDLSFTTRKALEKLVISQ
jgi:hypothetical protein